jgi:5,5'-dehydrodivanillate O-demethylase
MRGIFANRWWIVFATVCGLIVGGGTKKGAFMRRFWMPFMRAQDLPQGHAKPIRVMSEDFALYRGESGRPQAIAYRCPHRGAQNASGLGRG